MSDSARLEYGRQCIEDDDIAAVVDTLRSDFLTTGPLIGAFEDKLAEICGAAHAVVCNSGTAALYMALRAAGIAAGDSVVVPSVTFAATASAAKLAGLEVVFADVDGDSGLMSVEHLARALERPAGKRARAVLPVHLGGRVRDPEVLASFAQAKGLSVIEDACHAIGTRYGNTSVGACQHSLAACFSFHPVKTIAMGEGGAVTTNSPEVAELARRVRNHGMVRQPDLFLNADLASGADGSPNPWYYEIHEPSHNFRASDINCALGLSQLRKLDRFTETRRRLMARYAQQLAALHPLVRLVEADEGVFPGWHLCAVLIEFDAISLDRNSLMKMLRERNIGTQVHYIPVHLHPYYRTEPDIDLPGAINYYEKTLSLPLFASMTEDDVDRVVEVLGSIVGR